MSENSENPEKPNTDSAEAAASTDGKGQIYQALRHKGAFSLMPEAMFKRLLEIMQVTRFARNDVILKQGELSPNIYILMKGRVGVYINDKFLYYLSNTGDIFGEIGFINKDVCTATIRAAGDIHVLTLDKETLSQVNVAHVYFWLCRVLADKLTRTSRVVAKRQKS